MADVTMSPAPAQAPDGAVVQGGADLGAAAAAAMKASISVAPATRPSAAAANVAAEMPATRPSAAAALNIAPTMDTTAAAAVNVAAETLTPPAAPQVSIVDAAEAELQKMRAMPVRQYLECTVVPLLLEGLQKLVLDRPNDPVEFLVGFLSQNNPRKKSIRLTPAPPPAAETAPPLPTNPAVAADLRASIASAAPPAGDRASVMGVTAAPISAADRASMSMPNAVAPPGDQRASVATATASNAAPPATSDRTSIAAAVAAPPVAAAAAAAAAPAADVKRASETSAATAPAPPASS